MVELGFKLALPSLGSQAMKLNNNYIYMNNYKESEFAKKVREMIDSKSEKKIRRFPSGAVRSDNTGRPKPHWVSPYGIEEISMVLVENQNDFGAMNYTLGMPEEECLESLGRHYEECKEYWMLYKNTNNQEFYNKFRMSMRSAGFNVVSALHTIVLKERGYYKEIYDKTELVPLNTSELSNKI